MIRANFTLLVLLMLTVSCTSLAPYRVEPDGFQDINGKLHPQPIYEPDSSKECKRGQCVQIVEFDEFGNAFSRAQFNAAISGANSVAQGGGSVVVYVHGWHHSARRGDPDISRLLDTVVETAENTEKPAVGIYVGWRGDSINSKNLLKIPSYMLTFWDRKAAAHSIGNGGGVSELFRKLSVGRANNEKSRLLILGHSFGAAIVYSSISQLLGEQIRMDAESADGFVNTNEFHILADLIVLLNPAFEAMRMMPLYSLARSSDYPPDIPPRLVIITSSADWATKVAFPIGRSFGSLTRSYKDRQSAMLDQRAIGHYLPHITHQLLIGACEDGNELFASPKKALSLTNETRKLCLNAGDEDRYLVLNRCDEPEDCKKVSRGYHFTRGKASEGFLPHRFPIANIRTDDTVIDGHNDIWGPDVKIFVQGLLESAINNPGRIPLMPTEAFREEFLQQ